MRFPYKCALLSFILNNLAQFTNCQQEISQVCANDVKTTLINTMDASIWPNLMTKWPLKILDSLGKPPSGITTGNLFWLGSYQECLNVVAPFDSSSNKFIGEYCLVELYLNKLPGELSQLTIGMSLSLKIGLCFPSTCSLHDKSLLLNNSLKYAKKYVRPEILKENCQTKQAQPMDSTTIVLICVLSMYGIFVLMATLVELVRYLKSQNIYEFDSSGLGMRLFASFSALRSLKDIFKSNEGTNDIGIIHGIRTLSITGIIVGHTFQVGTYVYPWRNHLEAQRIFDYFLLQPIAFNATYYVTSFFVISGFLVTYRFLQLNEDHRQCPNIFSYYIHRYLRLTPPLLLLILFLAGPYYYINSGPIWPEMYRSYINDCRRMGWMSVLYIQNLVPNDQTCFPPGWYLSADTQLYILAPVILYPLYRKPCVGLVLMSVLFIGTTIASLSKIALTGQITFYGKHLSFPDSINYLDKVYRQTYYHAPSYMIGMTTGYLLYVIQNKRVALSKKIIMPCWICAIAVIMIIMYGTYPYFNGSINMGQWMNVMYGVFGRQAWALAVSWVILASALGYGGIINWLLTRTPLVILGRLTFCAYLVHRPIIHYYFYGQKDSLTFSISNMFTIFLANYAITMIAAVVLAVLIEMPAIHLLKQFATSDKDPMIRATHLEHIQELLEDDEDKIENEN